MSDGEGEGEMEDRVAMEAMRGRVECVVRVPSQSRKSSKDGGERGDIGGTGRQSGCFFLFFFFFFLGFFFGFFFASSE